jgi:hypothetical protein
VFDAHVDRSVREHNERINLAYHIESLRRRKRLPSSPKSLYTKRASREPQDWKTQQAMMDMWVHHTRNVERRNQQKKKTRKKHARK